VSLDVFVLTDDASMACVVALGRFG